MDDKIKVGLKTKDNPFRPTFRIVERRGLVMLFHGEYQIGDIIVRAKMDFELPSISDEFLDYIDSKCPLNMTIGIPNQERVNELWNEFNLQKNNF